MLLFYVPPMPQSRGPVHLALQFVSVCILSPACTFLLLLFPIQILKHQHRTLIQRDAVLLLLAGGLTGIYIQCSCANTHD